MDSSPSKPYSFKYEFNSSIVWAIMGIILVFLPEATLKIISKRYTRNEMWEYKFKDHWQK